MGCSAPQAHKPSISVYWRSFADHKKPASRTSAVNNYLMFMLLDFCIET